MRRTSRVLAAACAREAGVGGVPRARRPDVRSRGPRRASGPVVVQPTFVKVPLVSTTARPWPQDFFVSLIFVNLSLLPFSLNL